MRGSNASRASASRRPMRLMGAIVAPVVLVLAACTATPSKGEVTITVTGPNQWTTSGKSFGAAWDTLVDDFEKAEPGIKVKTNVLPIASFYQTESTQLAAGTGSDLMFNQAAYQPHMVHTLDEELAKPNPYDSEAETWLDAFNQDYFGPTKAVNANGKHEWIPITFSGTAILYNESIFEKAGVDAPIKTFADLMTACSAFKKAGYAGLALDNSDPWVSFLTNVVNEMMLSPYFDKLNVYDWTGAPGTATSIAPKSWAKAILTGELTTSDERVTESLKLVKDVYTKCGTENWSGITSTSGAMSNASDFINGKAAMTIGTSFAGALLTDAKFDVSSMAFPTITTKTTPLATGTPAHFGVSPYGSAFLIPSSVKGAQYDAAVKFLQFATAGENNFKLVEATTGIPSVTTAGIPEGSKGMLEGDWGKPMTVANAGPITAAPAGVSLMGLYDGYFLGTKSLSEEQTYLQSMWMDYYRNAAITNKWTDEDWAKG